MQIDPLAWRQLVAALEDGSALGRLLAPRLDSTQGFLIGFLSSTADPAEILTQLRSGGISRGVQSAACAMEWLASEVSRFLSTSSDACCVIEDRYAREGDTRLRRFVKSPTVLATGDVVHMLTGARSTEEVLDVLKKAATLPHTSVFWIQRWNAGQLLVDSTELASRCERVFVWVCDGEAYVELSVKP